MSCPEEESQNNMDCTGYCAGGPVSGSLCAGMFGKRDHTKLIFMDKIVISDEVC